jgi:hypothetical protein
MREATFKSLKINKTTSVITLEHYNNSGREEKELKAIAILLGGYNEFGRSIDLNEHRNTMKKFSELIDGITDKL